MDQVWVYQYFQKTRNPKDLRVKKLAAPWHGLFRINTYVVDLPTHPKREALINVNRLKPYHGQWTRPDIEEVPIHEDNLQGPNAETRELDPADDTADHGLSLDMLPPSSFVETVDFEDNDTAFTNTPTSIIRIDGKRRTLKNKIEYLVVFADGSDRWTPVTQLDAYGSFLEAYDLTTTRALPPITPSGPIVDSEVDDNIVTEY
jgi:hypothetical protein